MGNCIVSKGDPTLKGPFAECSGNQGFLDDLEALRFGVLRNVDDAKAIEERRVNGTGVVRRRDPNHVGEIERDAEEPREPIGKPADPDTLIMAMRATTSG